MAPRSRIDWQPAWPTAVRGLDSDSVFLEDREDVKVVVDSTHGAPSVHSTRSFGVAIHPRTFRSLARTGPALPDPLWDRLPVAMRLVEELAQAVTSHRPGTAATVSWVASDQAVAIVRRDEPARTDRRRAERIKLRVLVRSGDRTGTAVEELVLDHARTDAGVEALARRAVRRAETTLDTIPRPRGGVPVVFAPGVGGILIHELVGHALEADTVLAARSWLSGWQSQGGRPERSLRILDDPRRSRAAWSVDDDGVETGPTPLIGGGKVVGFLHDRRTAETAGVASTGHGRRASYRDPVRPRMGCTFVANGLHDPADLFEGIGEGIYVRRMEAASTDVERGLATFRVTDSDRIVAGKLERPIEPHLMFVDGAHALATLDRVADDLCFDTCIGSCVKSGQALPVSVGAPTIRVRMINGSLGERLK